MEWRGRRGSKNVIDVRGRGGGGRSMGRIGGFGGLGAVVIILIGLFLGVDLTPLLGLGSGGGMQSAPPAQQAGPNRIDDESEEFVAVVLADTEEVWSRVFAERGARYEAPELVLFSGAVNSACGMASAAVGPFYCPGDHRVYLDTAFFHTLESQLGARGDFARAYVIAHEVGHHVQNLIGVMDQVNEVRRSASEVESNALSVRVELQADCLAGMWARGADEMFGTLERGDIDEALDAASRIGDDTLQRQSQGRVVPDSFTHGTSEQRQTWFYRGFEKGTLESCDTFSIDRV